MTDAAIGRCALVLALTVPLLACSSNANASRPLGTAVVVPNTNPCPAGRTCTTIEITCPGVAERTKAMLARRNGAAPVRGMALFFSGGDGGGWYGQTAAAVPFFDDLQAAGLTSVLVRWYGKSWLAAAAGEIAGPNVLGCRPATAVRWAYDNMYRQLGLVQVLKSCGFCITGNSAGSSQVGYVLSHYGLDAILAGVFPTSGPPHAALAKGCLPKTGQGVYAYGPGPSDIIDRSYGELSPTVSGPCSRRDATYEARWIQDSVDGSGSFLHPSTRIRFVFGSKDYFHVAHGRDYEMRLADAESDVAETVVPNMPHNIAESAQGLQVLEDLLLQGPA